MGACSSSIAVPLGNPSLAATTPRDMITEIQGYRWTLGKMWRRRMRKVKMVKGPRALLASPCRHKLEEKAEQLELEHYQSTRTIIFSIKPVR